ncbi:hypothetical protein WPG_2235 [Winogradskyella sp. PG-2]|nr:hypothetical protein WPG_2235 [Winogradskyella sp. PG-2]
MSVVTDISISNGEGALDVIYIQIATGYSIGRDFLFLDGSHPNITPSWSISEGQLTLSGPASYAEFESAIADVKFQTTQSNFTQDKFFSINLGEANFLPVTGHYYFYVQDLGITWSEAKTAAAAQTYFGLQGYLATITTQEEVQLTGEQSTGTGWIGASDQTSEGVWIWETGPEAGQIFWNGVSNGSAPDGMFSFWNTNEPNNCCGGENYAHITDPSIGILGSWNDLPVTGEPNSASPYHPKGYLVEFGGMPDDPDINVSASTVIVTPKLDIASNNICDNGSTQISLTTNTDMVLWYASSTSTEVINSGLSYESNLDETTTFWLEPLFSGCTQSNRIAVTINVFDSPIANNITIIQCDDAISDGLSTFNLSNYTDDIIRRPDGFVIPIWDVFFFEDPLLENPIDATNYINTNNNQVIYAYVFDDITSCFAVSEVTLQVNTSDGITASLEVCDDFVVDGFVFFDLTQADNQILSSSPVNASVAYYVSYNDALLRTNEIIGEYFNEEQYNQVVYARVDIDDNCYSINEVNLSVKDIPNLSQYEEIYYCLNGFPETISLDGGIIDDIPNNYAYDWSTGETTINIDINEIGTYTVFVTRPAGCTNRRTISVLPSSSATIETIEVTDISENNTITILVSGEGDYVYALDDENGIYQESNSFENVSAGIHTVFIKDIKADCGIVSEDISILGFPKFFTPNGDTENDTWQISGFSSQFPLTASVEIFNRYGKLITVLNSNKPKWDGSYNGDILPTDDYWFIASLLDGRTFKGHFTLKR